MQLKFFNNPLANYIIFIIMPLIIIDYLYKKVKIQKKVSLIIFIFCLGLVILLDRKISSNFLTSLTVVGGYGLVDFIKQSR